MKHILAALLAALLLSLPAAAEEADWLIPPMRDYAPFTDTAGTICKAANVLMDMGASSVRAIATHPVFSGPAYERLAESKLEEIIVTDTIPLLRSQDKDISKITVLSVADIFATAINKVYNYESISEDFVY